VLPPCSPQQSQQTPLHKAARNNHVDAAKVLIARGALVDARNEVSLNPRTQGEKAQCTWQLGPGDARAFVCLQLLAAKKKEKRKICRFLLKRQLGLGFSV
jgi:hypothetical protein